MYQFTDARADNEAVLLAQFRGVPQAPRDLRTTQGTLEAKVTWQLPADIQGCDGWRVYRDNEENLIATIEDPRVRQANVKLPGGAKAMVYVSAVSALGREGPKVGVLVESNTDQVVVTGTTGGTGGVEPPSPPNWPEAPGGGRAKFDDPIFIA